MNLTWILNKTPFSKTIEYEKMSFICLTMQLCTKFIKIDIFIIKKSFSDDPSFIVLDIWPLTNSPTKYRHNLSYCLSKSNLFHSELHGINQRY